jgi:hypothetical protein
MAYLILNGEMPTRALYLAATTIVTAVVILVWPKKSPAVELTYTEPVLQTQES